MAQLGHLAPTLAPVAGQLSTDAGSTVTSGALPVAVIVALAAGVVSFASPCVLPLVPGFLGYVTGLSGVSLDQRRRGRLVLGALLFILGFSLVFIAIFLTASAVGTLLLAHQGLLMRIGGAVVILFGLVFLGLGDRFGWQPRWRPTAGLAGAPLLGVVFGLGMSPCISPVLGSIVTMSTTVSGDGNLVRRGLVLAIAYSIGMGLPFLLIAAGWTWAGTASRWLRDHHRVIRLIGGVLLVVLGVLMVTGLWQTVTTTIQSNLVQRFTTVI
ncbi:MAG TPA: cytochrome c biogenesis CcdA family protein [Segeticoccus sp.]|uniref:cytochrome c biogenesis CcdA family protein n=1 Tax=Segeticoccus sp. TaxID=2706531 RepID=UPI002D7F56C8|nr:cytochrome c biogenesis CcdA family protein [Segeticoccus sp.]HET8601071.1 cytochrome c biogenesis CcdA family protein [Segeticoccus sp.]